MDGSRKVCRLCRAVIADDELLDYGITIGALAGVDYRLDRDAVPELPIPNARSRNTVVA